MEFLDSISNDYLLKKGWIGDWGSLVENWKEGEPASVPTAFYYWNSVILSKIAKVLEYEEDKIYFSTLSNNIKKAYNQNYYDPETKNYTDGSQMANAFPLYLEIVPESEKIFVLNNLVRDILETNNGHLTTGVLGSKYMIDVLCREDREDVAYLLATQTGYPSWSDMVEKYTTMCEFWTLKQSHNHIMTGSIDAYFYKSLAGINFDENYPGCKKVIFKPYIPENLNFAKASIETINGTVSSEWERLYDQIRYKFIVPSNVKAEVYLSYSQNGKIDLGKNNIGIEYISGDSASYKYKIDSGEYEFILKY